MRLFLCSMALLASSQLAVAQESPVLALTPSSEWVLNYADDRCRILRTFGEGDLKTLVYFEQVEPDAKLTWVTAGPVISRTRQNDPVRVQFGPGHTPFEVSRQDMEFGEYGKALTYNGFYEVSKERIDSDDRKAVDGIYEDLAVKPRVLDLTEGASIKWLELNSERGGVLRLALGDMEPVYEAMNTCMANLLTHWGLDPERERQRTKGPVPKNMMALAKKIQSQYPGEALRSGRQATVGARVMIDAQGRIGDCTITELTEAEKFGAGICRQIARTARFEAAIDANGQAMPSYYFVKIRYEITG